jgi:hypothetical protein
MPTPAGGGGRPRALVIAGAVAAFAALATAALVTFRPWESSPAAADSAVAPPASQGSEPGGGAPAAGGGAPAGGNTQPGTAGNTGNAGTGGAGGTPASPDSAAAGSGPNAGERPLDAAAAGRALDALDVALHPDSTTPAVARQSLRTLNALMPRLPTAGDSVRADILRFQAYVQSEQIRRGCALLNSVRRRPLTENQRAVVRLYTQQICQAGGGG